MLGPEGERLVKGWKDQGEASAEPCPWATVALPASGEGSSSGLTFTYTTLNSPPPHVGATRRIWRSIFF